MDAVTFFDVGGVVNDGQGGEPELAAVGSFSPGFVFRRGVQKR
jgi:hypothetical protein